MHEGRWKTSAAMHYPSSHFFPNRKPTVFPYRAFLRQALPPPIIDFLTMFAVPLNWILHNAAMASKMPQLKQVEADANRPARRAAPCTSYLHKGRRSCDKQVKVVGRTSTVHGRQFITLSKLTTRCNDRPVVAKFSKSVVQDKVPQESILFFGDYPNFLITQCGYCPIKNAIL